MVLGIHATTSVMHAGGGYTVAMPDDGRGAVIDALRERMCALPVGLRAIDLRDEFRHQIEALMPPPVTRPQLGLRSLGDADEELARLRREHAELKESTEVLHSVILALVQENQWLARRRRRDNIDVVARSTPDNTPRP